MGKTETTLPWAGLADNVSFDHPGRTVIPGNQRKPFVVLLRGWEINHASGFRLRDFESVP